jgi:hypothetical protein
MKKKLTTLLIVLGLVVGSLGIPTKKANAGVIVMTASFIYGGPIIGIVGQILGFGVSVSSIYWSIANLDKAWLGYGLFMLDEKLDSENVEKMISNNYPELDSYLVQEISDLIMEKANLVEMNPKGIKEVILTEQDLESVLDILAITNPGLVNKLMTDLTKSNMSLK